ncbi:Vesicle trafficking between the ER and Golgi [Conglomerata obtusa]
MIRDLQIDRIKKFLSPTPDIFWKVLILDSHTKDIISPLLRLNDLRELGITTHFLINTKREVVSEIPGVYFIRPTRQNLKIVQQDVCQNLYQGYYLNFTTKIECEDLEDLAHSLSCRKLGYQIQYLYDQYVDFIALQNHLFIFNNVNSCSEYPKTLSITNDNNLVGNILSLSVVLNQVPFFVTNNKELNDFSLKVSKKIKNINILDKTSKRPLFILFNREFDVFSPLEHVWSYNALILDLLGMKLNKVSFDSNSYDINDDFFQRYQHEPFQIVAEKIEEELLNHKKEMASRNVNDISDKKKLDEILEKMPDLSKKNDSIQAHMAICLKLVEIIKERKIDDFCRIEKGNYKQEEIIDLIEKGTDNDIKRLLLSIKDENLVKKILNEKKIKSNLFDVIKQYKDTTDVNFASKPIYTRVASNLLWNVKKLLPGNTECPIYKEVENIFNCVKNQNMQNLYFNDPFGGDRIFEREISSIVVVCVGNGTFSEFNSLKNLEKKINIPIYYGCNEILSAEEIISNIER